MIYFYHVIIHLVLCGLMVSYFILFYFIFLYILYFIFFYIFFFIYYAGNNTLVGVKIANCAIGVRTFGNDRIIDCNFINNTLALTGNYSSFTLSNSTFTSSLTAMQIHESKITVDNIQFFGNGFSNVGNKTIIISNSVLNGRLLLFLDNNGIIDVVTSEVSLVESIFSNNIGNGSESVIKAINSTVLISSSTFSKNTCSSGIIYGKSSLLSLNSVVFSNNDGESIHLIKSINVSLNMVNITNNFGLASSSMYFEDCNGIIQSSRITSNMQKGMLILGGRLNVTNCVLVDNNCEMLLNSGGGIEIHNGEIDFVNNRFENNKGSNGGGVTLYNNTIARINQNIFLNNQASNGGGIYLRNSSLILDNSIIENNYGTDAGGIYSARGSVLEIKNSVLNNNSQYCVILSQTNRNFCLFYHLILFSQLFINLVSLLFFRLRLQFYHLKLCLCGTNIPVFAFLY